eukprot:gene57654-78994_t
MSRAATEEYCLDGWKRERKSLPLWGLTSSERELPFGDARNMTLTWHWWRDSRRCPSRSLKTMTVLLIAGTVVILGGLAAIGFGIPVKEFGFGNTLILTGTVGACTGLIMVSMGLAVRELKKLTLHAGEVGASLGSRQPQRDLPLSPVEEDDEAEDEATPVKDAPLFSRDQPAARPTGPEPGV